jgi:hypothetical protein
MLKAFENNTFKPHGIIATFLIELGGNIVLIEVEVVDAPLDYNMLLRHSWFYTMTIVVSSVFRVFHFPHHGKVVTIDHLEYCMFDYKTNNGMYIPFISGYSIAYENVGVGMFKDSSLKGTFTLPPPLTT